MMLPYPFDSPSALIQRGVKNRDTSTGKGVTVWRRQMRSLGFLPRRWGRFGSRDEVACRSLQSIVRITVDGKVGPQTWLATFDESVWP